MGSNYNYLTTLYEHKW